MNYKLGKWAASRPHGLSMLSAYAVGKIPAPPKAIHYGGMIKVPLAMDGNGPDPLVTNQGPDFEGFGDCVMAEKDHALKLGNAVVATLLDVPTAEVPTPNANTVVTEYLALTGGADTGLNVSATLNVWRNKGLFGTKIAGYAPLNYQNIVEIHQGVAFFGLVEIGIAVQEAQQIQFEAGEEWVWEPNEPVLGGHDVCVVGYDTSGVWVITWGKLQKVSYQFLANACDEAWVTLLPQFKTAKKGPKLDWATLDADLNSLAA